MLAAGAPPADAAPPSFCAAAPSGIAAVPATTANIHISGRIVFVCVPRPSIASSRSTEDYAK
jgi:hypothetical protein